MQTGTSEGFDTTAAQAPSHIVASPAAAPIVVTPSSPVVGDDGHAKQATLRVLHLVNGENFAGAERVQSHLGRCLPKFQVKADFACVKPGQFAEMVSQQDGDWGQCFDAAMSNRFDLRSAWSIRKLVRRGNYQLLHAHTPRTAMIAALASRLSGVPWIYHVHSPASRDSINPFSNRINAWVEKLSLTNCRHVITVSESLRLDCVTSGCPDNAITVVHNGVPEINDGDQVRRTAVPKVGGSWVLGMVALMRPRKGLEVMLESLAILRKKHDVKLRIIGAFESESYESFIDDQIARLRVASGVERTGFTENVPGELARLDALVLPSLFGEGLPMVVLEAMASGVPVMATRVEGTPEAVTDGVEGLLAEPRNPESLAESIEQLVTGKHDWTIMSNAARARHARDFSDLAMAGKTAEVYRRVVAENVNPES